MFTSPIIPIELSRKQTSYISSPDNSCSTNRCNKTSISENKLNPLIPGNSLTMSAVVSSASLSISSISCSKKRPRTSLLSSSSYTEVNEDTINLLRSINPTDYVRAGFKANGFDDIAAIVNDSESRFLPPTASMLEAYNTEILDAVRSNNLERAKCLYRDGKFKHGCNACNRFGESILHIACRRGHLEMVRFLVEEVGLSCITIRDDYHRTPLHDAFWTSKASPDVVAFLLKQPYVTELLLCKDKRGFTPLDYSRGEDRGKWLRFLWERRSELRPTPVLPENGIIDFYLKDIKVDDDCDKSSEMPSPKRIKVVG